MRKWLDQYDTGGPKPGSVYHVAPFNNGFSVGYTTEPNTIYVHNPNTDSWTKLSGSSYDTFSKQNPGIISSAPSAPKVKEKFVPKPDKVNVKEDLKKVEEKKSVQTSQEKAAESYKNLPADKKLPEIEVQGYNGLFSKYYNYLRDNYDKFSDLPVFSDYLKKKLDKAFAKGKYTSPVLRLAGIDKDQGQQAFAEQQARIISDYYKNNNLADQYVVLDKSRGTLSLYNGDDFVKDYSVGTGENVGDKVTRTVKQEGKVDWDAGNKMTGAGIYTVGKVVPQNEEYSMAPTWNFYGEKNQEDFVPMAMHSIPRNLMSQRLPNIQDTDLTNNRVTNGCINGVCFDLHDLYNQGFGMGEKMYVLPDNPANSYYVEDGQLKFRAVGQPWAYNTSPDVFKPLVFNFDENKFKNQVFQESDSNNEQEYNNTTVPFLNALQSDENKKAIMKATGISSDLYNNLAKMAFGIYGAESNYGDEHNWFNNFLRAGNKLLSKGLGYTASSPDVRSKAETYGQTEPGDSVGWTQFKWSNLDEAEKNLANSLGITSNTDLLDPAKSALFTTAILAQRYNVNLNDKEKANYWQELPQKWNKASNYPDRVKKNADAYLSYKSGGSTKRLKQYADGGTRTCPNGYIWDSKLKTCVKLYTDLGEFKIANQAYQDSSDAYNKTKDIQNPKYYTDGNPSWYSFNGSTQEAEKFMKKNNMDLDFDGKFPGKIQPTETGYFGEGVSYPIYKKPTQPVRYVKNPDDENVEIRNYGLILPYYPPEEPIKLNSKPVTRLQGYTTPTTLNPVSLPENLRQEISKAQDKSLSWEDTMKKYSDKYPGMEPIYQMTNNREGVGNQKLMGFTYRDYYDQENPRKFRPKEYRFEQKMGGTTGWLDQYAGGGPGKPKAKIDFGKGIGVMPVDINSQLYREIYPNLMSSGIDPATGQSTMYGTPMEGITYAEDSPQHIKDFRQYKQEYLNKDRSAFRDWYDSLGYNTKSVRDRAERYGYDKASKELLEKGVENLTEGQKAFISKSAYANKLEPGIFQRFQKAFTNPGFNLETLGNVVAPLEYTSNLVRGIMTGDVMAGLRGEPTNEYFRTDNMPAGYNPQELSIANNALTIATDPLAEMVALEEAPIRLMSAGSKGVGNILKPLANSKLMSYGKDLAYSIPKGKLPTYTNVGRWQPDAVPQWLTEAGETLTDEQKLLTGLWHSSRIGDQVPFYMRTRPGTGNLNLARLSDRQIAELENKMSAAAKGMSGKTNSVAASDDYLKGELIVPKDVNAFRKTIRFDINPQEYIPPANASKEWGDIKVGNFTDQLVKAQYPNILGIPRFYFPFKKGGSTGWLDQYAGGGQGCPDGYIRNWAGQCVPANTQGMTSLTQDVNAYAREQEARAANERKMKEDAARTYNTYTTPGAAQVQVQTKQNLEKEKGYKEAKARAENTGTITKANPQVIASMEKEIDPSKITAWDYAKFYGNVLMDPLNAMKYSNEHGGRDMPIDYFSQQDYNPSLFLSALPAAGLYGAGALTNTGRSVISGANNLGRAALEAANSPIRNIPGLTPMNLVNLGFGVHGANNLSSDISTGYYGSDAPLQDKILRGVETSLGIGFSPGVGNMLYETLGPVARNAYYLNPMAKGSLFKPWDNKMGYRVVNQQGYKDAIENFVVRPNPMGDNSVFRRPTGFPSFAKGRPSKNFLNTDGTPHYIMETDIPLFARGDINPVTGIPVKSSHAAARPIDPITGEALSSLPLEDINAIYKAKPHWLKGYERVYNSPKNFDFNSKFRQGKNIAGDTGSFNQGVYELPDYPGYLLKYEDPRAMAKTIPEFIDMNMAEMQKGLTSPNVGKVVRQHSAPNTNLYLMRRMQGDPLLKLSMEDLQNIPMASWVNYAKDYHELAKNDLAIDNVGSNVLYDPVSKSFKFIDLSPGVTPQMDPFWSNTVIGNISKNLPEKTLNQSIRSEILNQIDKTAHFNFRNAITNNASAATLQGNATNPNLTFSNVFSGKDDYSIKQALLKGMVKRNLIREGFKDGGPIIPELPEDFLHKANVYAWNQGRKAAQSSENAFLEENSRINQMRQRAENNAYSHDPSWDNKPFCITLPNGQPYCATRATEVLKESGFPLSITPSSRNLEDQLTKEKGWIPVDRPSVPGDISITRRPGGKAWHTMMSAGNNILYGDSGSGQDWHSYNYRGLPAMNKDLNGDTHFYRYEGNLPALQEDMQHKNFEYMYKTYLEPKKKGGVKTSADGYIDYLKGKGSNAYSIFAKGGSKGWLDNYK